MRYNNRRYAAANTRNYHFHKKPSPSCRYYVNTGLVGPENRKKLQEVLHDIIGYLKDKGCKPAFGSIGDDPGVLRIYYTPTVCNQDILEKELVDIFPYEWTRRETKYIIAEGVEDDDEKEEE